MPNKQDIIEEKVELFKKQFINIGTLVVPSDVPIKFVEREKEVFNFLRQTLTDIFREGYDEAIRTTNSGKKMYEIGFKAGEASLADAIEMSKAGWIAEGQASAVREILKQVAYPYDQHKIRDWAKENNLLTKE